MAKTHKITLETPLVGHEAVRELEFREPMWRELMSIGPAYQWVSRGEGSVAVPDHENIERYAEACLVSPKDPLGTFAQLGLADAYKVTRLFLDLCLTAEMTSAGLKTSSETSSSTSDGGTTTSPT